MTSRNAKILPISSSMITRDETPWMSSIGKTKATSIYPRMANRHPGNPRRLDNLSEGTDYIVPAGISTAGLGGSTDANATPGSRFNVVGPQRSRLGNYAQINGKTIAVSGTRRAIDQAGVADEYAYQLKKRGTELRRDLERDLIHTYQAADGTGNRKFGGYQAWINVDGVGVGNTGTNAAPTGGTSSGAQQNGTVIRNNAAAAASSGTGQDSIGAVVGDRVSLSLSDIDQVMQNIYQEGGKATKIMLSPKLRRDFSDLMVTDSGVRRNIDMDGKLRQSVDVYMSDFGDLMVVPNYIMGLNQRNANSTSTAALTRTSLDNTADSCALVYDPQWFNIATLRPLQEVDVGQRGDSTIGMMVEECTLEVRNPIGCGAIYGLV